MTTTIFPPVFLVVGPGSKSSGRKIYRQKTINIILVLYSNKELEMNIFSKEGIERCPSFREAAWAKHDKRVAEDEKNLRIGLDFDTDEMIDYISQVTGLTRATVVRRLVTLGIERICEPTKEIDAIQWCF